jgi:hypothetical protein
MGLVTAVWLAVLGVLGASSLIIARKPDAKEMIAKLTPYQGWIGAISALYGAYWTLEAVLGMGMLAHFPLMWAAWFATGAVMLLLGFILGIGIMKTFVKSPEAHAKADAMLLKLTPYQGTLGLVAIGLAAWDLIRTFI